MCSWPARLRPLRPFNSRTSHARSCSCVLGFAFSPHSAQYIPAGYSQVTLQAPAAAQGPAAAAPRPPIVPAQSAAFTQNVTRTAPATVVWLHEHFEAAEGVSLGRSTLYQHYCDHCTLHHYDPVNQASFGKLIRSVFPNLKTRRLGTRGNSKYHYYGIRLRDASPLIFPTDQVGGAHNRYRSRAPSDKPKTKKPVGASAKPEAADVDTYLSATVPLPDFPGQSSDEFSKIYHAHCKEVLRLAGKAEFSKIPPLWEKFWSTQGRPMFGTPAGIAHVVKCDEVFYGALGRALMVDVLAPMPEALVKEIRYFAKGIEPSIKACLEKYPGLQEARLAKAHQMAHSLRRFTALTHLAQAARSVFSSGEQMSQMAVDIGLLDFASIHAQNGRVTGCDPAFAQRVEGEFRAGLQARHTAEQWVAWVHKVLRDYVGSGDPAAQARKFLTRWSYYGSAVIRDLTLRSSPSFGSFHLIRLFLDEYVFYLVERVAEKGQAALMSEYKPSIVRKAPAPAPASDGEDDEDDDGEDFGDLDDSDTRSGLPSFGGLGGPGNASPLSDFMRMERF
eukprot:m.134361 g.134361  ORF g.134361 m.134361 type:complete len:559 (+) comp9517_c0_seq1:1736-3412(+)